MNSTTLAFELPGWRLWCEKCQVGWWDTDTKDRIVAMKKALYEHGIDGDHDQYLTISELRHGH